MLTPKPNLNLEPEPRSPEPEIRNPKPGTRNPNPGTRNPEPETRNPETGPEPRNPESGTRNPKPGTRSPEPEIRSPKSGTRHTFFFTLVTGPRRSLSPKLSDTRVYEPQIRARLGTTAHFCRVVVLSLSPKHTSQVVSLKEATGSSSSSSSLLLSSLQLSDTQVY